MKGFKALASLSVLLASVAFMLSVLALYGLPLRRASGGAGATINGDVNCDGRVDIADAITIIQHQFYGGPAACALAQDNFATKDDLAALAAQVAAKDDLNALMARVAAVETASKKAGNTATGTYIGDGKPTRTVSTGLPGKLREVRVLIADENLLSYNPIAGRYDAVAPEGTSFESVTFSDSDFTLGNPVYNNVSGRKYAWIAISSME